MREKNVRDVAICDYALGAVRRDCEVPGRDGRRFAALEKRFLGGKVGGFLRNVEESVERSNGVVFFNNSSNKGWSRVSQMY